MSCLLKTAAFLQSGWEGNREGVKVWKYTLHLGMLKNQVDDNHNYNNKQ